MTSTKQPLTNLFLLPQSPIYPLCIIFPRQITNKVQYIRSMPWAFYHAKWPIQYLLLPITNGEVKKWPYYGKKATYDWGGEENQPWPFLGF